ncbi:MAG: hypothetical protein WCE52_11475 [Candidatus Acidiferrum sp.]
MANANSLIAILTLAFDAHLDKASAFAGLSVYEDEQLWTEHQGRLAVRMGGITLALEGDSVAMLHRTVDGAHVDLESGAYSSVRWKSRKWKSTWKMRCCVRKME